jgi:two-component system response regulator
MSEPTILLVEDNPDDEALTLHAFQRQHLANRVVVVRDGVQALDYLFARGGRDIAQAPAVVLLDLKLPRIDGLEVLRQLRADERTWSQPVVVLTSSAEERDVVESYRLGCNSYVRKPVDFDEFIAAAQQLGLYWLLINRRP